MLDLSPHQVRQAETQRDAAAEAVTARLPETYQWLLTPVQTTPADPITWEAARLTGQGALADRAARRLKNDELLAATFAGTRLRSSASRPWRRSPPITRVLEARRPRARDPESCSATALDNSIRSRGLTGAAPSRAYEPT